MPKKHINKKSDASQSAEFTRPRRLLLEWLSVGVVFSLTANIIIVLVHALVARKEKWWCGEAPTVRHTSDFGHVGLH